MPWEIGLREIRSKLTGKQGGGRRIDRVNSSIFSFAPLLFMQKELHVAFKPIGGPSHRVKCVQTRKGRTHSARAENYVYRIYKNLKDTISNWKLLPQCSICLRLEFIAKCYQSVILSNYGPDISAGFGMNIYILLEGKTQFKYLFCQFLHSIKKGQKISAHAMRVLSPTFA